MPKRWIGIGYYFKVESCMKKESFWDCSVTLFGCAKSNQFLNYFNRKISNSNGK